MTTRCAERNRESRIATPRVARGLRGRTGAHPTEAAEPATANELGGSMPNCDLLVVQGHPLRAQLLAREALRAVPGLQVRVQRRRDDALSVVRSLRTPPGLVLLDLALPDGDGVDVLRAFRDDHRLATTPVVVTATQDDDPAVLRALRAHANAALVVRDDLLPFTDALRYLVRYWFRVHARPRTMYTLDTGAHPLEMR